MISTLKILYPPGNPWSLPMSEDLMTYDAHAQPNDSLAGILSRIEALNKRLLQYLASEAGEPCARGLLTEALAELAYLQGMMAMMFDDGK